jgi:hypothetical protein
MPRPRPLKPSYCFDKSSGRAFVTLNGTRKYLGPHGTQASRDEYDRAIGEWIAAGRQGPVARGEQHDGPTVSTVFAAFWSHAQGYYRHPDGTPTSEVENLRLALSTTPPRLRRVVGRGVRPPLHSRPCSTR